MKAEEGPVAERFQALPRPVDARQRLKIVVTDAQHRATWMLSYPIIFALG